MRQWQDDGVVLRVRPHGENAAVLMLLTRDHGCHAGFARGVTGPRARGVLQPGNRVVAAWSARVPESLGSFQVELKQSHAPELFDDPLKLAGLSAAMVVAERTMPEREPHQAVYDGLLSLIDIMERADLGDAWIAAYVRWELGLLSELGFALDLSCCAATGRRDRLAYVSPRSGRAVSREAGEPYHVKLLTLPSFLGGCGGGGPGDLTDGMKLTGYFLARHVFGTRGELLPPARTRFMERLQADSGRPESSTGLESH